MLKDLTDFAEVVTLIPGTGIQFLDFGFNITSQARGKPLGKISRAFWAEKKGEFDPEGREKVILHALETNEEGEHIHRPDDGGPARLVADDDVEIYRALAALQVFDGEWLPAPVLRVRQMEKDGSPSFDQGPLSWARIRLDQLDEADIDGNTHRVTIAFDTSLGAARKPDFPYVSPEERDATDPVEFQLVSNPFANRFFLEIDAIERWLRERYVECVARRKGRKPREEDMLPGEFWAQYILFLEGITAACKVPRITLVDTVTKGIQHDPIDVDLVIDVGNSRTCGILIEHPMGGERVDVSQATRLELRDLSRPFMVYARPFESKVEFAPAGFGSQSHARRVGRSDAFRWPSLVRVGPEAAWLSAKSDGTEGITGLSSPKRYLWDQEARPQPWVNTRGLTPPDQPVPEIKGPITGKLTEEGKPVGAAGRTVGMLPRYSRSSLYTLMLVELLSHAMVQINSAGLRGQRSNRDLPRRLRNLILTLPSATPVGEQKALRHLAGNAVRLLWEVMGWAEGDAVHSRPRVKLDWDEATCTHLVYLFNEVNRKFQGAPADFFKLMAPERQAELYPGNSALRIASIDIGGGTTDLMVIQHEMKGAYTIHPRQIFREGFRQAGDDIVKVVIEEVVLPAVARGLKSAGFSGADGVLSDLFGGDREGMAQQDRTLRALFVNQILHPMAIALLARYEQTDSRRPSAVETLRFSDVLIDDMAPQRHVLDFLEEAVRKRGVSGFRLADVSVQMDAGNMADIILATTGGMLDDLCDIVRSMDCDVLLLSGRPSRLPAVRDRIDSQLPISPHRIVAMHTYEVGNWYPFRSDDFRIEDPKTTAAVGAMLCQICEGSAEGFVMMSSELRMRSTARYIGIMDLNDQITEANTLLENVDMDSAQDTVGFTFKMERPLFLGFRQLPLERWKTTPLYFAGFRNPERAATKTPITVTMERADPKNEEDEMALETFMIADAVGADDTPCRNLIDVRTQTLRVENQSEAGYWRDSGVLRIQRS